MTNSISDNARKVSALASEKIGAAGEQVRETAQVAREATQAAYESGRAKATEALATGKAKASDAYASAQKGVKTAKDKTAKQMQDNPLAFLVGGVALGALVGALLPRTQRETKALGATSKKIGETASAAAKAAKDAGQEKLNALGVTTDAAKTQVSQIISSVVSAIEEAGSAATKTVRKSDEK